MSFAWDLLIWRHAEREFATHLLQCNNLTSLEFPTGKFKDWDIKATYDNKVITYEIKSDTMAEQTGNFVIEIRFNWKASWIYTSKADYIVYHIKWERWGQERGELILRLQNIDKRITKWWDWWKSELYVISCENLPKLFDNLFTTTTKDAEW